MSRRRGFVVWPRDLADHPALRDFADRAAFLDLVADAAWRPETVRRGRAVVRLGRGQVLVSVRDLAARWGWSVKRVRGFLGRLAEGTPGDTPGGTLADTAAGPDGTVLTIRDYDRFSGRPEEADTPRGTAGDTPRGTPGDTQKKEGRNQSIKERSPDPQSGERADAGATASAGAGGPSAGAVETARAVAGVLDLPEAAVPASAVADWLGTGVRAGALLAWVRDKREAIRRARHAVRYIGKCVRAGQVPPEVGPAAGGAVVPISLPQWRTRVQVLRLLGHWPGDGAYSLADMRAALGDDRALGLLREELGAATTFADVRDLERGAA